MDRTLGFGPGDRGSIPRRLVFEIEGLVLNQPFKNNAFLVLLCT
jgi:hypothetical protein